MLMSFISKSYTYKNSILNDLKHIFQLLITSQTHSRSAPCSHFSSKWTEMAFSENLPGSCSSHSFTFRWANLMSLISLWCKLQNVPALQVLSLWPQSWFSLRCGAAEGFAARWHHHTDRHTPLWMTKAKEITSKQTLQALIWIHEI